MASSHQFDETTTDNNSNHKSENGTTMTPDSSELSNQYEVKINSNQLQTFEQDAEKLVKDEEQTAQQKVPRHSRRLSLRTKATALAVAIGTLPVLLIGAIDYFLFRKDIHQNAIQAQERFSSTLGNAVGQFMFERYQDIELLRSLHAFADPVERKTMPLQEQEATLNRFMKTHKGYDNIIVFDLKGNTIAQSKSAKPFKGSYSDQKYFQEAIRTQSIVINKPAVSKSTGKLSVEMTAPIKELGTGKLIGVVQTHMPVDSLQKIMETEESNLQKGSTVFGDAYHLVDADGFIFVAKEKSQGENAYSDIPVFAQMQANKQVATAEGFDKSDPDKQLISYAPVSEFEGLPKLNWSVLIHEDTAVAFAAERRLLSTLLLGTSLTALLVGLLAAYLANRATRPILTATEAVEKLGQGKLDTRMTVAGADELAVLGSNVNIMADQLQVFVQKQAAETERTRLFAEIASARVSEAQEMQPVFNRAVAGAREILSVDRVVVYRFYPDWSGYITAESVADGWSQALKDKIEDPCIGDQLIEAYKNGRVVPTENVFEAGFHPEHLQLMERLQIKANLVTPIVSNNRLFGLLVAHHCQHTHAWQQSEIDFLTQLSSQLGLILDRVSLLEQQQAEAKRAQLVKDITVKLAQQPEVEEVFNIAVQEIRLALNSDRVVVYSFNDKWQGTVVAEAVVEGWPRALGAEIDDPCFAEKYVERYRQGRVQATENIYTAGLNECHLKQLKQFAVQANLVAPILQGGQLLGLLIAHQCSAPRAWQQSETDLFAQLATQVGFALDRAGLLEQQKTAKEKLQRRALELLMEVDPVSSGDLTIRASVTEDEIGTIADSYNATIANLRKIVTQVQTAATQVTATTSSNEVSVSELSQEALRQAQEIAVILERIQEMTNSIRAVAKSAQQAEVAVQEANETVEAGDAAMNRTVAGIEAIRETVVETSQKAKRLGESSQRISKVVKLISSFTDQTNLLALNAAIEAARAGEEGRGFAVVADEVQSLASQSAQATAEIESLVMEIQTETNEVVAAMEAGTVQVVEGTKLVDETRQSLNKITAVSSQISALVEAIATAAAAQSQTSETVTQSISDVAAIANQNSNEATLVSASFKELLAVATELQASAGQFKVS